MFLLNVTAYFCFYTIISLLSFQNFHDSVDCSELIKETQKEIDYGLYKLHEAQNHYKNEWKPFSHLWVSDKTSILKECESEGWKASCFESNINELVSQYYFIALGYILIY